MRIVWVLFCLVACTGDRKPAGNKPAGNKPADPVPSNPGAAIPSSKLSVTGEIHLSGALEGTFTWKDDMAVDTCRWIDSLESGGLGATLSDGKDSYIGLTAYADKGGGKRIVLTGGKLKLPHAGSMGGTSGVELSGTDAGDDSTVSVTYKNATVTADGQTVTINGQLSGNCKYSR